MAKPVSLVSVLCPQHRRRPDRDCTVCFTAADVSGYFHNEDRCIPDLCIHPHEFARETLSIVIT